MLSLTIVFDSVELVTRPWLKFGTTGTAAAGEANSNRKINRFNGLVTQ